MLTGKRILLVVSGSVAAYKALELTRLLRKEGAAVTAILTAGGARFVTREALAGITGVPLPAQRVSAARGVYAVQPMSDAIIARQQSVADTFAALRIIPARIDVRAAVWRPERLRAEARP